jgi:hypothetical protein
LSAYFTTSDEFLARVRAGDTPQARPLLDALRQRQAELRGRLEAAPCRSDDLREACGGILCELRGVGFLLRLVEEARQQLPRGEEAGVP